MFLKISGGELLGFPPLVAGLPSGCVVRCGESSRNV